MSFKIFDLGLLEFKKAWEFQKKTFLAVKNNTSPGALILCQHYPVITLGRKANKNNILASAQELENKTIQLYEIERGGDITYHGPGQITAYPVFNLNYLKKDINWFLRCLEDIIIDFLSDFGIESQRITGLTGVWIGKEKIASIGIAIKNWITFHGLSINIKKTDLDNFRLIRPCGMDIEMTCLESILTRGINISDIKNNFIQKFIGHLGHLGHLVGVPRSCTKVNCTS